MIKKGLAVIYDPHNLYQFIWYYCNKGKEKEWDALCLPNATKGEYMHSYCENAGIFSKIYKDDTSFDNLQAGKKALFLVEMIGCAALKKQKKFCKKLLNKYVTLDDYDEIVVIADVGFISGACVVLGDELDVVILEDGISDYTERTKNISREKRKSLYQWQGFVMSKLGYCSPGWFWFENDKYCIKYASHPEEMRYKNYREIRQLFDKDDVNNEMFNGLIEKIYPEIHDYNFDVFDAVIFTRPLSDYVIQDDKYKNRLVNYINSQSFKHIMLKEHPREKCQYSFGKETSVTIMSNKIPAEIILPYLRGTKIFVETKSAIIMYIKPNGLECNIIDYDNLYEESLKSNTQFNHTSRNEIVTFCDRYAKGCYSLINI